jgi:hypothetical protein
MHQWLGDGAYALTATYGGSNGALYEMIALTTHVGDNQGGAGRDVNPNWDTAAVQSECLASLRAAGFPDEVTGVAAAATRFFDLGICFQVGASARVRFSLSSSCADNRFNP